jgi:hypothetical protein
MNLLSNREGTSTNDVLERRFIGNILREEAAELDSNQVKLMSSRGFTTSKFYDSRGFDVLDGHKLQYTHAKELRFIDMKRRTSKSGTKTKVSHPIHNKPIYSMLNNAMRRLSFEYTKKMKAMLSKEITIEM